MPEQKEFDLGHLKFGKDAETGHYVCHMFDGEEFIAELCRMHSTMLQTPEQYKAWMAYMGELYTAVLREKVLKPIGEENGILRTVNTNLRGKAKGVN